MTCGVCLKFALLWIVVQIQMELKAFVIFVTRLVLFCCFVYAFSLAVTNLTSEKTGTNFEYDEHEKTSMPALTFCPHGFKKSWFPDQLGRKILNVTFLKEVMGTYDDGEVADWFKVVLRTFDDHKNPGNWDISNKTTLPNILNNVSWSNVIVKTAKRAGNHLINCYTVVPPDEVKYQDGYQIRVFITSKPGFMEAFSVEIHAPYQSLGIVWENWKYIQYFTGKKDKYRTIGVDLLKKVEYRASTSKRVCSDENRVQKTKLVYDHLATRMKCNLPWIPPVIDGGRLCDSQKDFDLYSNILKNLSAEPRYVLRSSVPNCKSESWDYKVFYDEIFPVTKDSHKLQAANTVRLAFSMFDTRVGVTTESKLYEIEHFIADFGGYLGLLLGASIPSILESVLDFGNYLFSRIFWTSKRKSLE